MAPSGSGGSSSSSISSSGGNMTVHMAAQAAAGYVPTTTATSMSISSKTTGTTTTTTTTTTTSASTASMQSAPSGTMSKVPPPSSSSSTAAAATPTTAPSSAAATNGKTSISASGDGAVSPPSVISSSTSSTTATTSSDAAAAAATNATSTTTMTMMKKKEYIWEWNLDKVCSFLRKSTLFPIPKANANNNTNNNTNTNTKTTSSQGNNTNKDDNTKSSWNGNGNDEDDYQTQLNVANTLLSNFRLALQSASVEQKDQQQQSNSSTEPPSAKRVKTEHDTNASATTTAAKNNNHKDANANANAKRRDTYNILDSSFSQGVDIVHVPGTILSRLTVGGYMNALSGQIGGIVDPHLNIYNLSTAANNDEKNIKNMTEDNIENANGNGNAHGQGNGIPTACNMKQSQLQKKAVLLHHNVRAMLEMDMMESTPQRIINLLCPELSLSQVSGIRHRVVETVVYGRGTNSSAFLQKIEEQVENERSRDVSVGSVGVHGDDGMGIGGNGTGSGGGGGNGNGTNNGTNSGINGNTNGMNNNNNDDDEEEEIPTMPKRKASNINTHEIAKFKRCKVCNNNDQGGNGFVTDKKNGDVICTQCGTVVSESLMHEGSMYRKFEGEEDRNHHGDVSNPLYSNSYNMATALSGVPLSVGAGMGGYGSGGGAGGSIETILKRVHNYTEMNISQMGKEEKKTRTGYKDRQKKEAFVQMNHVGDALSLHQAVLQRAKELFSGFRDDRELLQQFKGVIAACLCEAFDQLSDEGKQLLKMQATASDGSGDGESGGGSANGRGNGSGGSGSGSEGGRSRKGSKGGEDIIFFKQEKLSARANRRNELHSSNLAGKGGLMLNLPQQNRNKSTQETMSQNGASDTPKTPTTSALEEKPVSSWELDDVRSWLLETSRIISRKWFNQQDEVGKPGSSVGVEIAHGTVEEMEGRLVQHTLKLCTVLENEIMRKGPASQGKRRVVTPRVNEMGHLSIRWQHGHERGSGGAGGVGFSGSGAASVRQRGRSGSAGGNTKTAGQILRMKTAPQLKKAIGDNVAGEAFYKELRALMGRQDAKVKQQRSEEASMRRMNQMRRKPELQARVQS